MSNLYSENAWEINPYENVANLTPTVFPTFAILQKAD